MTEPLHERHLVRWLLKTFQAAGLKAEREQPIAPQQPLRADLLLRGLKQPGQCLWPPLAEAFPAERWLLELFVSRRPGGPQLASTQSKAWELVRQAAQGGASPEACRLGVLMLCWQQPLREELRPAGLRPLAPGVWLWDGRLLGLFLVHLPELPEEAGYSGLRLLYARSAGRLRALGVDGTLEETVKVAAMGALKELARDLGDEELVRLSTEELLRRGRQEGRREGIRIGEQRGRTEGIRIGEQRGRREALLELARQLLGEETARALAEEPDLEALQRRLTELLQRR